MLSSTNVLRQLTNSNLGSQEAKIHHQVTGSYTKVFNDHVQKVLKFMEDRGNPYPLSEPINLHNFAKSQ